MKKFTFFFILSGLLLTVPCCKKTDSSDPPPSPKDPYGMFEYTIKTNGIVSFTNTSTDATSYLWDFGDLSTSTSAVVTFEHQYLHNGTYKATLTAYGNGKSSGAYANLNITSVVEKIPIVETNSITNITQTTASSGGNVTSAGSSSVTARGVCWSTSPNPTVSAPHTFDGTGTGSFTSNITGLTANTPYYVKAYATNSAGTAYGNQVTFTTSGGGPSGEPCPGIPTISDQRDGQVYPTVQIGNQCWLQKNMNYQTGNSWCYDNNAANCITYGRLYDWSTALDVCPSGWHLPSDDEWTILTDYLGGESFAGGQMKSTYGWSNDGNGSNSSGFTALPGGYRDSNTSFYQLTNQTFFWSSTDPFSTHAWDRGLGYLGAGVSRSYEDKRAGSSVRCLQD